MTDNSPGNSKDSDADKKRVEDLLATAKERFNLAVDAENEIRRIALEDMRFSVGDQWPDEIKRQREADERPCLTINRLPQFIRQITNDQRQNRPSIKVSPIDSQADVETAKVLQGLVRHIEYSSGADVAYDTAFDHAVRRGLGFFRIITDFCSPTEFDLEAKFKAIPDSFLVYFDPYSVEPDGSDANFAFVFADVSKKAYEAQYPESDLSKNADWASLGDASAHWISADSVRLVEYFYKEFEDAEIIHLSDGSTIIKGDEQATQNAIALGLQVKNERKTKIPVIKWAKINGIETLDEKIFPGQYIPIIPVYGDRIYVDGEKRLEGIVTHAKDSQRMINYHESAKTEAIALVPKAPWVAAEGQIEPYKKIWQNANKQSVSVLPYVPKSIDGTPVPPPQRTFGEAPIQALSAALAQAGEQLKEVTGIYDAALGAKSNESSGIAIQRRSMQAQTSNFHFVDNLARSIRHAGRILVDIIPTIYDGKRTVRILGEGDQQELVTINALFEHNGKPVNYDFSAGKYDVAVQTGPSFASKREEARESMLEFIKAYPNAAPMIGDLLVKNFDWTGSDEIAERLVPPGFNKDKEQKAIPPEVQQQLQQMDQMIHQLTVSLNHANEEARIKKYELDSRERIEYRKLEVQAEIELAKLGSKEGVMLLQEEIAQLNTQKEHSFREKEIENLKDQQGAGLNQPTAPQQINQPAGANPPGGTEY